jgi:hypothetical protein
LVPSEIELSVEGNEEIQSFIASHVENGLHDREARTARFLQSESPNSVEGTCREFFSKNLDFLEASSTLATQLNDVVTTDRRISPGALVVSTFRAKDSGTEGDLLALLKIDPGEGFQPKTEESDGRRLVTFQRIKNIVPSARERLQKGAFIRPLAPRPPDHDFLVLDRQKRGSKAPAQFFLDQFLRGELAADSHDNTEQFYRGAWHGIVDVRDDLSPEQVEDLHRALETAIRGNEVEVDGFLCNLPVSV